MDFLTFLTTHIFVPTLIAKIFPLAFRLNMFFVTVWNIKMDFSSLLHCITNLCISATKIRIFVPASIVMDVLAPLNNRNKPSFSHQQQKKCIFALSSPKIYFPPMWVTKNVLLWHLKHNRLNLFISRTHVMKIGIALPLKKSKRIFRFFQERKKCATFKYETWILYPSKKRKRIFRAVFSTKTMRVRVGHGPGSHYIATMSGPMLHWIGVSNHGCPRGKHLESTPVSTLSWEWYFTESKLTFLIPRSSEGPFEGCSWFPNLSTPVEWMRFQVALHPCNTYSLQISKKYSNASVWWRL